MPPKNKWKFKYIESKHKNGCAIACMAMILGIDYDIIEQHFINDFTKGGIKIDIVRLYLNDNGMSIIEKRDFGFINREFGVRKMLEPFADIHYISFSQFIDTKFNHAWVMLKNGTIYCPNIGRVIEPKSKIYEISSILGCFRD